MTRRHHPMDLVAVFSILWVLSSFNLSTVSSSIRCYVCSSNPPQNLCSPLELYGNETHCPEGVSVCYKSWSVEADPKTVRRCGSKRDIPNVGSDCKERLQGADKVLVCKCATDLCNDGTRSNVVDVTTVVVPLACIVSLFF